MSDNFKRFVESIESPGVISVANSIKDISKYDLTDCSFVELEQIILDLKPNSFKTINSICYVIGLYAKFLNNNELYAMIQSLDKNVLWKKAKVNATKKFISNTQFNDVIRDIDTKEELNSDYYQILFQSIYEGIYSDSLSVIKNLRSSDISGNIVTLKDDNGKLYDLKISSNLATKLKELGAVNSWERRNRFGTFKIPIEGLYPDSCFKVEIRKISEFAYKFSYYRFLKKISGEYLGCNLSPFQLFISGIMHRIKLNLSKHDISLEEAFSYRNHNKLVSKIISDELARCNYNATITNFKAIVNGRLDEFEE